MKPLLHTMCCTFACLALSLAGASAVEAATVPLGQTAPAGTPASCLDCTTFQQASGSTSPVYAVPSGGGTLTSWSVQGAPSAADCLVFQCLARLRVLRPDGSGGYTVSAESAEQTIGPGALNTFPVSLPVQPGDLLGLEGTQIPFSAAGGTDDVMATVTGPPIVGSLIGGLGGLPFTLTPNVLLNVSAVLDTGGGAGSGTGSGGGSTTTSPGSTQPQARFAGVGLPVRVLRVGRSGRVRIPVGCPAAARGSCRGELRLVTIHPIAAKRGRLQLAAARFAVPAGRKKSVLVRISRAGRAALARHHRLSARLTAAARDDTGAFKASSRTLSVRRR
jgi:hypothetical protein